MKIIITSLIAIAFVSSVACDSNSKEELTSIRAEQIIGDWSIEEVLFNGRPSSDVGADISAYLGIKRDNTFVRNYVQGRWTLKKNSIELVDVSDSGLVRNCDVIELSENTLVLRFEITEEEYHYNFDAFQSGEKIIFTERYKRIE